MACVVEGAFSGGRFSPFILPFILMIERGGAFEWGDRFFVRKRLFFFAGFILFFGPSKCFQRGEFRLKSGRGELFRRFR